MTCQLVSGAKGFDFIHHNSGLALCTIILPSCGSYAKCCSFGLIANTVILVFEGLLTYSTISKSSQDVRHSSFVNMNMRPFDICPGDSIQVLWPIYSSWEGLKHPFWRYSHLIKTPWSLIYKTIRDSTTYMTKEGICNIISIDV